MAQTPPQNRTKRIGAAILRVLAEQAIAAIPVIGPYAELTLDLYAAIREELARDQGQQLTREQIVAALRSLTYQEAQDIVDQVLHSTTGEQATEGLSAAQREDVRRRLVNIPSEIDLILRKLEAQEKQETQRREAQREAERQARHRALHQTLKSQLQNKELAAAYRTAETILRSWPKDRDALKAERFLFKRLAAQPGTAVGCRHSLASIGGILALAVVAWLVFMIAVTAELMTLPAALGLIVVVMVPAGLFLKISPSLPRSARTMGCILFVLLLLAGIYGAFQLLTQLFPTDPY